MNSPTSTPEDLIFRHLHRLAEPTNKDKANDAGDRAITEFLATEQLGTLEQPITCTLYPRTKGTREYIFEVSPQLGCTVGCHFCGCGEFRGNLSPAEIVEQIDVLNNDAIHNGIIVERPKISFADGGELILNPHCSQILEAVTRRMPVDVKISSVLPGTPLARSNLEEILRFVQKYYSENRDVAFQVSLSSTDPNIRQRASRIPLMPFADIRTFGQTWISQHPANRKITLTFTLTSESHCVASEIADELPPSLFVIRLHPYRPIPYCTLTTIAPKQCRQIESEFLRFWPRESVIREEFDEQELNQFITGGTRTIRERIRANIPPNLSK